MSARVDDLDDATFAVRLALEIYLSAVWDGAPDEDIADIRSALSGRIREVRRAGAAVARTGDYDVGLA